MLSNFVNSGGVRSNREHYLQLAETEAAKVTDGGSVNAAAILVKDGEIVASGRDRTVQLNDPIAVAVADCFRNAGRRNDQSELELYCSPAPDMLAAGIVIQFGIGALIVRESVDQSSVLQFMDSENVPIISLSLEQDAM